MATKTGRSDGGAEPVKYLTQVEGARRRPGASTVFWLDASGDQLTMLLLRFPRQHQKPRPTLTSTQSVCSQRAPKKRRVSVRPEGGKVHFGTPTYDAPGEGRIHRASKLLARLGRTMFRSKILT
jgi:hypothetical protein